MRPLGVGLVYLEALESLFLEDNPDLSVLELEPEGFWQKVVGTGASDTVKYVPNRQVMARIARLPRGLHMERWIEKRPAQSHLRRQFESLLPVRSMLRDALAPSTIEKEISHDELEALLH